MQDAEADDSNMIKRKFKTILHIHKTRKVFPFSFFKNSPFRNKGSEMVENAFLLYFKQKNEEKSIVCIHNNNRNYFKLFIK